jgi:hypothetical protein
MHGHMNIKDLCQFGFRTQDLFLYELKFAVEISQGMMIQGESTTYLKT